MQEAVFFFRDISDPDLAADHPCLEIVPSLRRKDLDLPHLFNLVIAADLHLLVDRGYFVKAYLLKHVRSAAVKKSHLLARFHHQLAHDLLSRNFGYATCDAPNRQGK